MFRFLLLYRSLSVPCRYLMFRFLLLYRSFCRYPCRYLTCFAFFFFIVRCRYPCRYPCRYLTCFAFFFFIVLSVSLSLPYMFRFLLLYRSVGIPVVTLHVSLSSSLSFCRYPCRYLTCFAFFFFIVRCRYPCR